MTRVRRRAQQTVDVESCWCQPIRVHGPQSLSVLNAVSVGAVATTAVPPVDMKSFAMIEAMVPSNDVARSQ